MKKSDVDVRAVARLLHAAVPTAPPIQQSARDAPHLQYWQNCCKDERELAKLEMALSRSVAVAAAFTTVDVFDERGAAADSLAGKAPAPFPSFPPWNPASLALQQRTLVGFARAMGDSTLAATIYDVAVHPAARRRGVGRRLVRMLVEQLTFSGMYDIGVIAPHTTSSFFTNCNFAPDDSTYMRFGNAKSALSFGSASVDVLRNVSLQQVLLSRLPDVQSEPVMCSKAGASYMYEI